MFLIIGLGNPGRQYARTRHNVGFRVLDVLAERLAATDWKKGFDAEYVAARIGNEKVVLLRPLTFMNESGRAARAAADFWKVPTDRIVVVSDDKDSPLGRLRLRADGSAGGHNGLKSLFQHLGTQAIARVKIGVGTPEPGQDTAAFVLSGFRPEERKSMAEAETLAADAVETVVREGLKCAMDKFNKK